LPLRPASDADQCARVVADGNRAANQILVAGEAISPDALAGRGHWLATADLVSGEGAAEDGLQVEHRERIDPPERGEQVLRHVGAHHLAIAEIEFCRRGQCL